MVKNGPTGKFRFSLLSTNGKIVATSEAYESRAACLKGVDAVRRLAADAGLEDLSTGRAAARK